jgi:hypothetical protein
MHKNATKCNKTQSKCRLGAAAGMPLFKNYVQICSKYKPLWVFWAAFRERSWETATPEIGADASPP